MSTRKCKKAADVTKVDRAMAAQESVKDAIRWYEAGKKPMLLAGFNWYSKDHALERLPLKKPASVTQYPNGIKTQIPADDCGAFLLAPNDAGGRIYFRTNSKQVFLKFELIHQNAMAHMAYTGLSGFDLYCRTGNGQWGFAGVTRFGFAEKVLDALPFNGQLPGKMCDCLIHFPLYNGVKYLSIGVEEGAVVEPLPRPWKDNRKIVLYGTSITQGGCASRPGMAASNIISRDLSVDVMNFGFSGSGKLEPEIAKMLLQVPNPSLFILDHDWNIATAEQMAASLPGFLDILRKKYPAIPILIISRTPSSGDLCTPDCEESRIADKKRQIEQKEVARRKKAGDKQIFFLNGDHLLGKDYAECLVDGCHMTDLGFYRWAKAVEKVILRILK